MPSSIDQIISFLKEIEKFKTIERQTWTSHGRNESDAEHAWHLAMFILLFEKELPARLDMAKMLKFALIHDLVEIYAGDTFFFDAEARKDKKEREAEAAKKLFAQLPPEMEKEYLSLFDEYESQLSPEARMVNALDKIQPILQNLCSEGKSWKKHAINYDMLDKNKRPLLPDDAAIQAIYEKLMAEAKEKGFLS